MAQRKAFFEIFDFTGTTLIAIGLGGQAFELGLTADEAKALLMLDTLPHRLVQKA